MDYLSLYLRLGIKPAGAGRTTCLGIVIVWLIVPPSLFGQALPGPETNSPSQTPPSPPNSATANAQGPDTYKKMSLAELMDQDVTSVSKEPEPLAWHPTKNLEISVVGQNLLHDQHPEYTFPSPTQVQIERSVYGKIAWHF